VTSTNLQTEFLLQFRKQREDSAILLASNRPHNEDQTKKQRKTERERTGEDKEQGKTKNSSYKEIKKYVLTPCEIGIEEQAEKVGIQCHPLHPPLFDELCLRSKRWWVNKSMFTTEKSLHVHCFIPGLPHGKAPVGHYWNPTCFVTWEPLSNVSKGEI
jgi:hypothetical protein